MDVIISMVQIEPTWLIYVFTYVDSLGSPLCVLYKPNTVAAAALLLATHFSSTDKLSDNWHETLEDINASEVHGKEKKATCLYSKYIPIHL